MAAKSLATDRKSVVPDSVVPDSVVPDIEKLSKHTVRSTANTMRTTARLLPARLPFFEPFADSGDQARGVFVVELLERFVGQE